MTPMFTLGDWRDIRLVVFDVDGTLYSQRSLRLWSSYEPLAPRTAQISSTSNRGE